MNNEVRHWRMPFQAALLLVALLFFALPAAAQSDLSSPTTAAADESSATDAAAASDAQQKQLNCSCAETAQSDSAAATQQNCSWKPANTSFIVFVIALLLLGPLTATAYLFSLLRDAEWSFADALSESVDISVAGEDGKPIQNETGQPLTIKKMQPSSSRMVAFMGMIAILFVFFAFGAVAVFGYAKTGKISSVNDAVTFMSGGLTLFAPYAVNKLSTLFNALAPKS